MMMDVFTSPTMPFYKFGHLMFLKKIETTDWLPFIVERFRDTGKYIDQSLSALIVSLADNHPYYVQQLAQQTWLRTEINCTKTDVTDAHVSLVNQLSLLFTVLTESLTNSQIGFLNALLAGEEQLSSQAVIQKYGMGTSSNVMRIKKSLVEKDILDFEERKPVFQDPIYAWWLKNCYFGKV
jgi:hypothetical protein